MIVGIMQTKSKKMQFKLENVKDSEATTRGVLSKSSF